jgi:mannose-6-phosphate isomerase class I
MEGAVTLQTDGEEVTLTKGQAALISAKTGLQIQGTDATQLFRATVPDVEKRTT